MVDSDKILVIDAGIIVEFDHPYNLLKNKELDFTSHLSKSLMDKHNQLTHMENNETAGLLINVDEAIMDDCLTIDQLLQSIKWELEEKEATSFYVILSFAGDYHI